MDNRCSKRRGQGQGWQRNKVGRPKKERCVNFSTDINFFKPNDIPVSELEIIELSNEQMEVLKLKNLDKLNQTTIAEKINTSQSTIGRILEEANKKITDALVNGKAIEIKN